ncbi:MAG: very short patch repair endonuclease [Bifidobacteriaceae bacterium]|jgi:DNA mismatch endonuclease (patch repair protein)|nr:very short patch repair endonuclease [Bifidobacteriaceae bacterium]
MAANRSRDTRPELALRRALHRLGFRYRVAYAPLAGSRRTVDIAFTRAKVAVFLDGCFWHGCPEHYRPAIGRRKDFWADKIASNAERDRQTTRRLESQGWSVLRFWEHEPLDTVLGTLVETLRERRTGSGRR